MSLGGFIVQLSYLSDRQTLTAPKPLKLMHKGQSKPTTTKKPLCNIKIFEIPFYYAILCFYCTLYTPNREFISATKTEAAKKNIY